ncbi:MAG: thiamine pyrophosphate-dependent enzyme [Pseudomonadota bacterium]|nr:thiamine pyrophosphate-binding protein [Arenicellales bacterium]MEC8872209.1 thiamine pyrophosphate-dependent enzyme [Pseudomonadota bacterium]
MFLSLLAQEGVTHIFGNPGTTELAIMHALNDRAELAYVLGLQESVVVAMADGFARASGALTACNVHVAPGLGNAIGSIYNAYKSGSPLIITAGQQEQGHGLTEPLLYGPMIDMARPVVKWAHEISRIEDMPRIIHRAAKIATTAPTGPVFLSLPGDILNQESQIELGVPTRVDTVGRPSENALEQLTHTILASSNPVILAGSEVVSSDAQNEVASLAETLGAPVYQQTVPSGAHFTSEHPAFMGSLTRDQQRVRKALAPYDLMLAIGCDILQMSVWSPVDPLPPELEIIQIGLRDWEIGKNYPAKVALRHDVRETLDALVPLLIERGGQTLKDRASAGMKSLISANWSTNRAQSVQQASNKADVQPIEPQWLMMALSNQLTENCIVVDEGLTAAKSLLDFMPLRDRYSYFGMVSGGIGWGIAAAIGVQLAQPERRVVAVIGDGSSMYSPQALWTAAHLQLPITFVILNNRGYRILKERLIAFHGDERFIGMDFKNPPIDIAALSTALGTPGRQINQPAEFIDCFSESLKSTGPTLLEVMVEPGPGS